MIKPFKINPSPCKY